MENFNRTTVFFLLLCVLAIFHFQPVVLEAYGQNVAQNQPEKPSLSKILTDTISLMKRSHKSSLEKIKTVIHDMQIQLSPKNMEGVRDTETGGVKGMIKEAVGKSFDESKEMVEESAKSAAKAVNEAVHNTAEKVTSEEPESEL